MKLKLAHLICFLFLQTFMPAFPTVESKIIDKPVNFGHKKKGNRMIDTIIIHSVYNASGGDIYDVDLIIKQFAKYKVSPHYLIDREGTVYRMVKEQDIAYHAGKSKLPDGSTHVNSRSIGIEIITSKDESPSALQIEKTVALVKSLQKKYPVKYVLRHSDIAPNRKTDPWNLDWEDFLDKIHELI